VTLCLPPLAQFGVLPYLEKFQQRREKVAGQRKGEPRAIARKPPARIAQFRVLNGREVAEA